MRLSLPCLIAAILMSAATLSWGKVDEVQEATKLYKQGNKTEAQSRLIAHLSQNAKDVRARFLLGVIYTEQKRNSDAIKIFTSLTEDHAELPEPYNNLAVLYASQGDYEKARKALELAIRTHPSYAVAHENLGDIYATLASQAYDKALQLDNGNAGARSKLALIKELVPKPGVTVAQIKPEPETPVTPPVTKEPVKPEPAKPEVTKPETSKPEPVKPEPAKPTTPAEPPKPAKPEKVEAAKDPSAEVLKAVHAWAAAWSKNDSDRYLSHYAPEFRTPKGESRSNWEAERRARIAKPKSIEVSVGNPKVTVKDANHATVAFRQHYRSDTLKTSSGKTLEMVRKGDRWMIQGENIVR